MLTGLRKKHVSAATKKLLAFVMTVALVVGFVNADIYAADDNGVVYSTVPEYEVNRPTSWKDSGADADSFCLYFSDDTYIDEVLIFVKNADSYYMLNVYALDEETYADDIASTYDKGNKSDPYAYMGNPDYFYTRFFTGSFISADISMGELPYNAADSVSVQKRFPAGIYKFEFTDGYGAYTTGKGEIVTAISGETDGNVQEMTEAAIKTQMKAAHAAALEKEKADYAEANKPISDSLPTVTFSSTNLIADTDPSTAWGSDLSREQFEVTFYVDDEINIKDFYFSTAFTGKSVLNEMYGDSDDEEESTNVGIPTNLNLEFKKYSGVGTTTLVATTKAAIYNCPVDNPFIHNTFTQVTGASNIDLTLTRGVYYVRIIPTAHTLLLAGAEYDFVTLIDTGVGITGTAKSAGNTVFFTTSVVPALGVLINGVNSGKSLDSINDDYSKAIVVEQAKRKAEAEAAAKAAAEKATAEKAAAAAKPITLKVDGVVVKTDSPPILEDGRTLAPVRAIVEALGFIVSWNSSTQVIDIYDPETGDLRITMTIGSRKVRVSTGIYGVMDEATLDVPAKLINGRTMVPVRFIAEQTGCTVTWDEKTRTVIIVSAKG